MRTRRDQIQAILFAEMNRLEHFHHACVTRNLEGHIAILRKALAALEAQIAAHLQASETLARKAALMRTPKCIGAGTATVLLAHMRELGAFSRAAAACMAGVGPFDDNGDKTSLPRHIEAGRAAVCKALYIVPR